MERVTDPELLKMLNSNRVDEVGGQGAPSSSYGEEQDDGSIWDTAMARMRAQKDAFVAANVGKDHSDYANRKFEESLKESQDEQAKLGFVGNIAAGAISYAPTIAAGMVNPFLGAGVATGQSMTDALIAQRENGGEFDTGSAWGAGAASGLLDLATGGMGSKAKAALAPTAPLRNRLAINAAEDVTSNVGAQAFENLAAGKDWDSDLGTAAVVGGVAGAGVRGTVAAGSKSMGALQRATQTPINEWGDAAIKSIKSLRGENNFTPTPRFSDDAVGYANKRREVQDMIDSAQVGDEATFTKGIDAAVNMSANSGGSAASLKAMELANQYKLPLTDAAFNIDVHTGLGRNSDKVNLASELGLSSKEIQFANESLQGARISRIGKKKSIDAGETKAAYEEKFKASAHDTMGQIMGTYNANMVNIQSLIQKAEMSGATPQEIRMLRDMEADFATLDDSVRKWNSTENLDTSSLIETASRRLLTNANKLGINDQLVGVNGKPGSFDPIVDAMAVNQLYQMIHKQMPNFRNANPQPWAEKPKSAINLNTMGGWVKGGFIAANPLIGVPLGLAGAGVSAAGAKNSQRKLRKAKNITAERMASLSQMAQAPVKMTDALKTGGLKGGADQATVDLANAGIDVGGPTSTKTETGKAMEAEAQLNAEVQAAQAAQAASAPKSAPLQPDKIQRAPEPVQEPTAPIVEPTPAPVKSEPVKPAKPKIPEPKVEEPKVEEPAPKKKATSTPTTKPETPKKEATPEPTPEPVKEPEVEAPKKVAGSDSEGLRGKPKQPHKAEPETSQKASEEPTEAPATETEAPAPKADFKSLKRPLEQKVKELESKTISDLRGTPQYRELLNARRDLEDIAKIKSEMPTVKENDIAQAIEEIGGMDALRKEARGKSLATAIRNHMRATAAPKLEAAKAKLKEVVEQNKTDSEAAAAKSEADKAEARREQTKAWLEAGDTPPHIVKDAMAFSDDPAVIKKRALTLMRKEADDAASKAAKENQATLDKAKKAQQRLKNSMAQFTSRSYLDKYVKGLGVSDSRIDDILNATYGNPKAKHPKKVTVNDVNNAMNKIDKLLAQEEAAYNKLSRGTGDAAAEAHAKVNAIKKGREAQKAKMEAEAKRIEQEQAEVEAAAKADVEAKEAADLAAKLRQEAADANKLNSQMTELADSLKAGGASDDFLQEHVYKNFFKRDKPMSDEQFRQARVRAVETLQKAADKEAAAVQKIVDKELGSLNDESLRDLSKSYVENSGSAKGEEIPRQEGVLKALSKTLTERGMKDEAAVVNHFNDIMKKIDERRALFPNHKDYWISREDIIALQRMKNDKEGGFNVGNLFVQLRMKAFGSSEGTEKYVTHSNEKIATLMKLSEMDDDIKIH